MQLPDIVTVQDPSGDWSTPTMTVLIQAEITARMANQGMLAKELDALLKMLEAGKR